MIIDIIAGARPNFMKIAPIIHELKTKYSNINPRLIHTGQHYDNKMSDVFFEQLGIPKPDYNLACGGGSSLNQISKIISSYSEVVDNIKPNYILVVGDVNSTSAASLVAKHNNIKLGHVEGGLRSFDRSMPEEINRLIVDSISDDFFVTSIMAKKNLLKEGVDEKKIHFVGNTMIDTLIRNIPKLKKPIFLSEKNINSEYILLTLHRPSNVDDHFQLEGNLKFLDQLNKTIIFPVHPRTARKIKFSNYSNFIFTDALPYLEFIYLLQNCEFVITDSGGITEEATFLGKRCYTLRNSTERPETVNSGSNILLGENIEEISVHLKNKIQKDIRVPDLWDGNSAKRICKILSNKI